MVSLGLDFRRDEVTFQSRGCQERGKIPGVLQLTAVLSRDTLLHLNIELSISVKFHSILFRFQDAMIGMVRFLG